MKWKQHVKWKQNHERCCTPHCHTTHAHCVRIIRVHSQRSYNWGKRNSCGGLACPMLEDPQAPCLLADDQWAYIPRQHADVYYMGGCMRGPT